MRYKILNFVILNAKYLRKRLTFKCRNFGPLKRGPFLNYELRMIKVFHLFLTLSNVGTVSNYWTPRDEILRGYFELTLPSKTKSQAQVFRAYEV